MAVFSKYAELLDYHLPYNCYEIGHTWTPSCVDASVYVGLHAFRESLKIYLPLYAKPYGLGRLLCSCYATVQAVAGQRKCSPP
ncbi:hypothetical protein HPB51_022031 [Rhipicephalus microplus]|uniref:Transmembrane protein 135 N-terminal domain-containing protein n=1 Tax=Rhipicephalus microplus TaxID=6941 RepID=A0A9J6DIW7_RHIMP|nr:hypothetical protein HPB51_022031 [Rhipicephalus microplus]